MQQILLNDGYYLHQPNNLGYWYLYHFNSEPYLFLFWQHSVNKSILGERNFRDFPKDHPVDLTISHPIIRQAISELTKFYKENPS